MAGTIGVLAFIWLVCGYFIQTKELSVQAEELKKAVDQHRQIAQSTKQQIDVGALNYKLQVHQLIAKTRARLFELENNFDHFTKTINRLGQTTRIELSSDGKYTKGQNLIDQVSSMTEKAHNEINGMADIDLKKLEIIASEMIALDELLTWHISDFQNDLATLEKKS